MDNATLRIIVQDDGTTRAASGGGLVSTGTTSGASTVTGAGHARMVDTRPRTAESGQPSQVLAPSPLSNPSASTGENSAAKVAGESPFNAVLAVSRQIPGAAEGSKWFDRYQKIREIIGAAPATKSTGSAIVTGAAEVAKAHLTPDSHGLTMGFTGQGAVPAQGMGNTVATATGSINAFQVAGLAINKPAGNWAMPTGMGGAAMAMGGQVAQAAGGLTGGGAMGAMNAGMAAIKTFTVGIGVATGAVLYFGSKMNERAREISMYDSRIASAVAGADIRKMMADIREARTLGGSYAKNVDTWSRLTTNTQDIWVGVKGVLIETINPVLEVLNGLLIIIKELVGPLLEGLRLIISLPFDAIRAIINWVKKKLGMDAAELPDALRAFLNQADMQPANVRNPVQKRDEQRLNVPAFAGLN